MTQTSEYTRMNALPSIIKRQCALCMCEKPISEFNVEHIFLDAIGGALTCQDLCTVCNSQLGEGHDSRLANHALVRLTCTAFKIRGKNHGIPNPFRNSQATTADGHPVRVTVDRQTGMFGMEIVQRVAKSRSTTPDGRPVTHVRVTVDSKNKADAVDITNKILRKQGLPAKSAEDLEPLMRRSPAGAAHASLSMSLDDFVPSLLKTAYLLALRWLGPSYLTDPMADKIRSLLIIENPDESDYTRLGILGEADMATMDDREELTALGVQPHEHMGVLVSTPNGILVNVYIFQVLVAKFWVSQDSGRYGKASTHFVFLDAIERQVREQIFLHGLPQRP
jgi:hypothetical protein